MHPGNITQVENETHTTCTASQNSPFKSVLKFFIDTVDIIFPWSSSQLFLHSSIWSVFWTRYYVYSLPPPNLLPSLTLFHQSEYYVKLLSRLS